MCNIFTSKLWIYFHELNLNLNKLVIIDEVTEFKIVLKQGSLPPQIPHDNTTPAKSKVNCGAIGWTSYIILSKYYSVYTSVCTKYTHSWTKCTDRSI